MFPFHNPAQQVFNWHCRNNNISDANQTATAVGMQDQVYRIRKLYTQPIGRVLPYNEDGFRSAYLLAYFPYYIEPLFHVLQSANLPDSLFTSGTLNAAFFGGGPCPEMLGLAAYLRKRAPRLASVEATAFDRQTGWRKIQQNLINFMLPYYKSGNTKFNVNSKSCDVVECLAMKCTCGATNMDIFIAQNFLAEIYEDRERAVDTFERLVRRSNCKYLVFVDNKYEEVKGLMNEISANLYSKGLTTELVTAETQETHPNFKIPAILQQHLFIGTDGLKKKSNVKFHYMVLEIAR